MAAAGVAVEVGVVEVKVTVEGVAEVEEVGVAPVQAG